MSKKPRTIFEEDHSTGTTWHHIVQVNKECGTLLNTEMTCDLTKGPAHEDCQRVFLQTEDCFQKVLCNEK